MVSGPANDGSPAFSPDGNTIFFTRSTANWGVIVESHHVDGHWTQPTLAPFSGEWPDSSPAMLPDGSYLVFESNRPKSPLTSCPNEGEPIPGSVSNLWRVDRVGTGWTKPARLPDTVNLAGQSIWKPSIAADGTIYFVSIDKKGGKRLYSSQHKDGAYQQAQPPSFSDGTTLDGRADAVKGFPVERADWKPISATQVAISSQLILTLATYPKPSPHGSTLRK